MLIRPGGSADFLADFREQAGVERRQLARFQHHRAARRERWRDLCDDLVQRVVPRRDCADNAHRLTQDQRMSDIPFEGPGCGEVGEAAEHDDRRAGLDRQRHADRHADFLTDGAGDLLLALLQAVGQLAQPVGALRGRRERPSGHRTRGAPRPRRGTRRPALPAATEPMTSSVEAECTGMRAALVEASQRPPMNKLS